jgi:hypothetical protein
MVQIQSKQERGMIASGFLGVLPDILISLGRQLLFRYGHCWLHCSRGWIAMRLSFDLGKDSRLGVADILDLGSAQNGYRLRAVFTKTAFPSPQNSSRESMIISCKSQRQQNGMPNSREGSS